MSEDALHGSTCEPPHRTGLHLGSPGPPPGPATLSATTCLGLGLVVTWDLQVSAALQEAQQVLEVPQRPPPKPGLWVRSRQPEGYPRRWSSIRHKSCFSSLGEEIPRGVRWEIAGGMRRDTILTTQRKCLL